MRKFILVTLLAAASLAPAAAYAQDRDHEDRGRPRGNPGGWQQRQADGGGRPQQQAPQPRQFQQAQPQQPQAQQPRVAPEQQPRFQTPAYRGNPNWRGGDNGPPQNQPQVQVQPQNQPRNNWQGGRPAPGSQGRPDQRGDGDLNFGSSNGRHDDRDGDRRWNNNGYRNGDGDRRWNNNGHRDGDGDRRWNNGGNWSNNWRHDNRYDWRRYRTYNHDLYHLPRYYAPYGWNYGYRRFSIGITLNSFLFSQNYWIDDPLYYRLPPAYGPYRWVRYYDDALLVNIYTGDVVDVVYDIFW